MREWEPDLTSKLEDSNSSWYTAHLWIVPAKVEGIWKLDGGQINFTQTFQFVTGTLTMGNNVTEFSGKLDGAKISFKAGGTEYNGTVSGNTISGTRTGGGSWKATR